MRFLLVILSIIGLWPYPQTSKTIYGRYLPICVISYSVCAWQAFLVKVRTYLSETPFRCSALGKVLGLTNKRKHSKLSKVSKLRRKKKFYELGRRFTSVCFRFLTPKISTSWNRSKVPTSTRGLTRYIGVCRIDNTSSISTSTIPVSSLFCSDLDLTVFCLSSIIKVLILAVFTKPAFI